MRNPTNGKACPALRKSRLHTADGARDESVFRFHDWNDLLARLG
ncbi:hypothetical protein [Rhodocaloribacter sp.]